MKTDPDELLPKGIGMDIPRFGFELMQNIASVKQTSFTHTAEKGQVGSRPMNDDTWRAIMHPLFREYNYTQVDENGLKWTKTYVPGEN